MTGYLFKIAVNRIRNQMSIIVVENISAILRADCGKRLNLILQGKLGIFSGTVYNI